MIIFIIFSLSFQQAHCKVILSRSSCLLQHVAGATSQHDDTVPMNMTHSGKTNHQFLEETLFISSTVRMCWTNRK